HLGAELDPPLSHGFKVSIGTLAMTAFYEKFFEKDIGAIDLDAVVAAWPSWEQIEADIRSTMTGPLIDKGINETREKYVDAAGLRARLTPIITGWPALKDKLRQQVLPAKELQDMLARAGAPTRPEDIGLTPAAVKETFPRAMYYRSRYTVLDVSRELGLFNELVDEVFAPGGIWS
ncbi:MAG: sn-glycerol-1-phosphate dehydrogenase, partial [Ancrocorticia sp.]